MQVTVKVLRTCFVDNRYMEEGSVVSVSEACADLPYFERQTAEVAEDEEQMPPAKRGRRARAATVEE